VHDDASTDNSVSLIEERYPQVKLLLGKQNVGFCISNNRMVTAAQGKFILLLNNDATLHFNALETLYNAYVLYGDGIYGLPQYNAVTKELIDIGCIYDLFLNPIPNKKRARNNVGMVIGACMFLSRKLWNDLGGFPEWFGSLGEDLYICCLARLRGFKVMAISQSGFDHWVGQSFGGGKILNNKKLSTRISRRAKSERNKTFVMIICFPAVMAWILIPVHFILLTVEGLLLSLIKKDLRILVQIYWFCLKETWGLRCLLMQQRQKVQYARKCSLRHFLSPFTFLPHKLRMLYIHGFPEVK